MALQKFLALIGGRKQEVSPVDVSAGAGDAGKVVALDNTGRLSETMMPVGIGADTKSLVASEALAASNLVNVWNDAGTPKARKADATVAGKEASGFVLAGAGLGANALVYFEGTITGLTGLVPGARYYLDTTAGAVTATPPSGAGNVVQFVGVAISDTELSFEPDEGVVLA